MDPEDIRRTLHDSADSVALPERNPRYARLRAARTRRRCHLTQGLASVALLVAIGVLVWPAVITPGTVVTLDQGESSATPGQDTEERAEMNLRWEAKDVAEGIEPSDAMVQGMDGVLYAVSTAPGARVEDYDGDMSAVPQALYRSTDGANWEAEELDTDSRVAELDERDGVLYTLSTGSTETGSGRVGVSTDEGGSWDTLDLPSDAVPPETSAELGEPTVSGALAVGADRMVATVRTSYPVLGGVFADEDQPGYQLRPNDDGVSLLATDGDDRPDGDSREGCVVREDHNVDDAELASLMEGGPTHVVAEGDSLASIAEEHLGEDTFWQLIVDLNEMDEPRLEVGQELAVPDPGIADVVNCGSEAPPGEAAVDGPEDSTAEDIAEQEPAVDEPDPMTDPVDPMTDPVDPMTDPVDPMTDPIDAEVVDHASWQELDLEGPEDLVVSEVFISDDGTTWERVDGNAFDGERPQQVVASPDGFVALTSSTSHTDLQTLWHSDDGVSWEDTAGTHHVTSFGVVDDRVLAITQDQAAETAGEVTALTSSGDGNPWEGRWNRYNLIEAAAAIDDGAAIAGAVGHLGAAVVVQPVEIGAVDGGDPEVIDHDASDTSEQYLLTSPDGHHWSAAPLNEIVGDRDEPWGGWVTVTENTVVLHEHVPAGDDDWELETHVGTPVRE